MMYKFFNGMVALVLSLCVSGCKSRDANDGSIKGSKSANDYTGLVFQVEESSKKFHTQANQCQFSYKKSANQIEISIKNGTTDSESGTNSHLMTVKKGEEIYAAVSNANSKDSEGNPYVEWCYFVNRGGGREMFCASEHKEFTEVMMTKNEAGSGNEFVLRCRNK